MDQETTVPAEDSADPPTPRVRRVNDVRSIRLELGGIYRAARRGELEVAEASRLANMLWVLARQLETSDLEARLEALEVAMKDSVRPGRKP